RAGTADFGTQFQVRALDVIGSINRVGGTGPSENDFYAFTGKAGDVINIQVLSATLRTRFANTIDSVLRVFRADGTLVPYYGGPAVNHPPPPNPPPAPTPP